MPSKPAAWLETCPGALRWYERAFFRTPCAERGRLPVQPPRRLTPWLINYVDPQDSTAYLRLPRKEGGKQCSHLARGANKHDAKCKENANGGCCAAVIHEGTKTETRKLHTTSGMRSFERSHAACAGNGLRAREANQPRIQGTSKLYG